MKFRNWRMGIFSRRRKAGIPSPASSRAQSLVFAAAFIIIFSLAAEPLHAASGKNDPHPADSVLEAGSLELTGFNLERTTSPDGRTWLAMSGTSTGVFNASVEEVAAALCDFTRLSDVFTRIDKVDVISSSADHVITRQRTVVRFAGFVFVSVLELQNRNFRPDPGTFRQVITLHKGDGATLNNDVVWIVERAAPQGRAGKSGSGGDMTRIRYSLATTNEARYPFQEVITRSQGPEEIADIIRQLASAIARRRIQR